ncbi:MAG: hypothetical protein OXJ53_13570 [Gammaproteobacteria bacterium]|nr:hypothetical protein [Gammaproteobacteria bacterium]MDE0273952.1 hypothetical protein [Gammaproteobacteria bacterium]
MSARSRALAALFLIAFAAAASAQEESASAPPEPSAPGSAAGRQLEWISERYGYIANNESLRSLLFGFGVAVDVPVVVSDEINLVMDGAVPSRPAGEFLDYLNAEFQVIWVFDGTTLYFYDVQELATESIPLPFSQRDFFQDTLEAIGVFGRPLQWTFLPSANLLQVSGPPRFVDLVKEVTGNLGDAGLVAAPLAVEDPLTTWRSVAALDDEFAIRIFRIEYGYVDSAANDAAGAKAPVVNLAEMVAQLMNVSHVSSVSTGQRGSGAVPKLKGEGLIQDVGSEEGMETAAEPAGPGVIGMRASGQEAFVIGDPRLNAVIVRDLKHRMPTYERLIAELDVPVDQIEIGVSVLDIDSNEADEWRFSFQTEDAQLTNNVGETVNNLVYSRNQLDIDGVAVRLRALRESRRSRLLTQPTIVTLDNQEASFQNNRTFYVRLGGERSESVDLAPVSYGWVVRIRPHIIYQADGSGNRSIQLAVHLEDGARSGVGLAVTGVPEVAQNLIQTQAVIREGNSLLVGGYTVREQSRVNQRIPVVGRVPLVGRLFSSKNDRERTVARYFLITPRVLPATIHHELDPGFDGAPIESKLGLKAVPVAIESAQAQSNGG